MDEAIRCGNTRCKNQMLQKAPCSDDGMCHNHNDARILSFALKLQCFTAKLVGVVGVGVSEEGDGGGRVGRGWVYRW